MIPKEVKELRERLHLTQEIFARILGVSFATVNRWENGKTEPTGDYARVLQTLQHLTLEEGSGSSPDINWQRVGALSAMAAVAGFSPLLTLGAALAPVLIAQLPSWSDVPLGNAPLTPSRSYPRQQKPNKSAARHDSPVATSKTLPVTTKAKVRRANVLSPSRAHSRQKGL